MFIVESKSVREISSALSRREEDVKEVLLIHDDRSEMGESMIRELEQSILKGGVICDPEVLSLSLSLSPSLPTKLSSFTLCLQHYPILLP